MRAAVRSSGAACRKRACRPQALISVRHHGDHGSKRRVDSSGGLHPRALDTFQRYGSCEHRYDKLQVAPERSTRWLMEGMRVTEHAAKRQASTIDGVLRAGRSEKDGREDAPAGQGAPELVFDVTSGSYLWRSADGSVNTARRQISPTTYDMLEIGAGNGAGMFGMLDTISSTDSDNEALKIACVEPSSVMRQRLEQRASEDGLEVFEGNASGLPLPDDSVHAVVALNSFHWFATPAALFEISRVLHLRGYLGLMWQLLDTSDGSSRKDGLNTAFARDLQFEILSPLLERAHITELDPMHMNEHGRPEWTEVFECFLGCYYGSLHKHMAHSTVELSHDSLLQLLLLSPAFTKQQQHAHENEHGHGHGHEHGHEHASWDHQQEQELVTGQLRALTAKHKLCSKDGAPIVIPCMWRSYWCQLIAKD